MTKPTPEEEFAAAPAIYGMESAPKETWIVARDRHGEIAHVYWNSTNIPPGEEPSWARFLDDEPFDAVAWVPSSWSYDDIVKKYE